MAIISTSTNLSAITYATGESLTITNGAILTVNATPTIRPGTTACLTSGKLRVENTSTTVPLIFDLSEMNHDFRFEAAGILEFRGAPMSLGVGSGAQQVWDFTALFGGVIKTMTYCEIEETPGAGDYMPWEIINEDPKFSLNTGEGVAFGGASPASFTAGNTLAGRALFWHETKRTLRTGDGVNGSVIPSGCEIRIPNIYISNRMLTNSTRSMDIRTLGTPTAGSFTLEIKNEAGTILGTTAAIAYNATAAAIDAAIEAVTGAGTVTATGGALPTAVTITWAGALLTANGGLGDFPSVRVASSTLTGGTNPTVHCVEANAAGLSLIDLSPLGTFDAEWVSFSNKIRVSTDTFTKFRAISCGFGGDLFNISNSNGNVELDGVSWVQSPFTTSSNTQVSSVYGDASVRRFVGASKGSSVAVSLQTLPRLSLADRIRGKIFGTRSSTSTRTLNFATLPQNIKITNVLSVGATAQFLNLIDPKIVNMAYADSISNAQSSLNAMTCYTLANCINPTIATVRNAGAASQRSLLYNTDTACSNVQVIGGDVDFGNNGDRPVYLGCAGTSVQNLKIANMRSGPMIDTVSNWLANSSKVRKVFGTFATAQSTSGLDASTGGQYDLVTSTISGINEAFAGVGDFVGGNYTDPSLTPTTGHITFGPFGTGVGLELTGAGFTDALGAFLLPEAGDSAVITMPFAMHGITGFQNVAPYLYADIPGAVANGGVIANTGGATGGTYTVSVYDAAGTLLGTTTPLAYNANSATIDAAVTAIPGTGSVGVSGSLIGGLSITFGVGINLRITADGSGLTGGETPGVMYAVGRARLQTGTEAIGNLTPVEFAMRVPGTAWPAYASLTSANLISAFNALVDYDAGGSGLEMRLRITAPEANALTKINQISLPTTVDPDLWVVGDATITFQGAGETDVIRIVRASDSVVLYTFQGSGLKEFVVGENFDAAVFFRRELADGTIVSSTYPSTQQISFGTNGTIPLFSGAEVQLAQSPDVSTIKTLVEQYLDAAISSRSTFNPTTDTVARVTLVDTTTTNSDMRGTDNALLAASYTAPLDAPATQAAAADALAAYDAVVPSDLVGLATVANIDAARDAVIAEVDQIPVNPLLTTDARLDNLDAAVSSRLASASYTAPANADIAAILEDTGTTLPTQIAAGGGSPTEAQIYTYFTSANRQDTFRADVSGLLTSAAYTAPDNAQFTTTDRAKLESLTNADLTGLATSEQLAALNNLSAQQVWAHANRALTDKAGFELSSTEKTLLVSAIRADIEREGGVPSLTLLAARLAAALSA